MIERNAGIDQRNRGSITDTYSHFVLQLGYLYARSAPFDNEGAQPCPPRRRINRRPDDDKAFAKFFVLGEGFITACDKNLFTVENPLLGLFIENGTRSDRGVVRARARLCNAHGSKSGLVLLKPG